MSAARDGVLCQESIISFPRWYIYLFCFKQCRSNKWRLLSNGACFKSVFVVEALGIDINTQVVDGLGDCVAAGRFGEEEGMGGANFSMRSSGSDTTLILARLRTC